MFLFTFNVATRTFKIIYEAHLTLLLDSTVLDYQAVPSEDRQPGQCRRCQEPYPEALQTCQKSQNIYTCRRVRRGSH